MYLIREHLGRVMYRYIYWRNFLLTIIGVFICTSCAQSIRTESQPGAIKGVLDLSNWDFNKQGVVHLSGEYEFYWLQHLFSRDFKKSKTPEISGFINVPDFWYGLESQGQKFTGSGYATYRLSILLKDKTPSLALKFLDMGTAFRVFIDGRQVLSVGQAGKTPETTIPQYSPQVVELQPVSNQIELIYHVANFHYSGGGAWEVVRLGEKGDIYKIREKRLTLDLILFGSILMIGLYHLGLFAIRKKDLSTLYFGIFCLIIAIRMLTTVERYLLNIIPGIDWELFVKTEYLSYYLAVPVFSLFMHSLFPKDIHKSVLSIIVMVGIGCSIIVVVASPKIFSRTLSMYQIFTFFCLGYGLLMIFISSLRKRPGAIVILVGFLVLSGTVVNDILDANQILQTGQFTHVGLFIFTFSQAFHLSSRFLAAFRTVEQQTKELSYTNQRYKMEIDERLQAELELLESEKRFRSLIETAPSVIICLSTDHSIIEFNPEAEKFYGRERAEVLGKDYFAIFLASEVWSDFETEMKKVISGIPTSGFENAVLLTDGREKTLSWNLKRLIDGKGQPFGIIAVGQDITQRKYAEEALRISEEKFSKAFRASPGPITISTFSEGRLIEVNQSFLEITGFLRGEVIGQTFLELNIWSASETYQKLLETLRKKQSVSNMELDFRMKSGELRTGLFSAEVIKLDNEKCVLMMANDITERNRLQEELARAQRLETAGRVAGQIAHDFNNLLNPLAAYPSLIKDELDSDDHNVIEMVDEMEIAAKKIAEINQQLLTLGRRGHYAMKLIDLNELLQEVVSSQSLPKGLKIRKELAQDLLKINGGGAQLTRIFLNLTNNANEAVNGVGTVILRTENVYLDEPLKGYKTIKRGEYVKLDIIDNGEGIAPDIIDKIFDPFFTTKKMDKMRGSGLGLSVVHSIIEDHNGYITVKSIWGEGTTFSVYFPIARQQEILVTAEKMNGGKENVLVVDDDPVQRKVARQLLSRLGYQVQTVSSGEIAVAFVQNNPQDLLILDMVMDGMDGTDTYKKILEFQSTQKAIILSGFALSERVKEALRLGAGSYISKPITLDSLATAVRNELDRKTEEITL